MMPSDPAASDNPKRVLLLGATGTIGQAVAQELSARGHAVTCFIRPRAEGADQNQVPTLLSNLDGIRLRYGEVTDKASLARDGFAGDTFDCVISCLASRTGVSDEAWAVDYHANLNALDCANDSGVTHFILLSAICVQRPKLAFQHAKLAFEQALIESGLTWSIIRPTAFFKSLSGQVERVKAGKSYMMFGDGTGTACKPISDADLATFIVDCLDHEDRQNAILPIGGPGPAITPKQQGEKLFELTGTTPKYSRVAPGFLLMISRILRTLSWIYPPLKARAEYARIGHYYATESMLVLDPETGIYREDLTPSFGTQTLFDHYRNLVTADRAD